MIISHQQRFVMLVSWKTASSTLHLRLARFNESRYPRFYYFNPFLNRVVHQHLTCAEFDALPEAKAGYRRAAFVRNPYDRFMSAFRQVRRDVALQSRATFPEPWIKELVMRQLDENRAQLARANYDLNAWIGLITEDQIFQIGRNPSLPLHPAHYWTHVAGTQYVHFIGRVEDFEADFSRFCNEVEIPVGDRVSGRAYSAKSTGQVARSIACAPVQLFDRRSIDKVNSLLALDFDLFGYEKL
jgi:hypothetical protein